MKKGFTLIELIIVIIIIGVLATIGMAQYGKMVEKSRWSEARSVLGSLRTLGVAYYLEYDGYATDIKELDNALPSNSTCNSSYYFYYTYNAGDGTATRCASTSSGKKPTGTPESSGLTKILTKEGTWSGSSGTSY